MDWLKDAILKYVRDNSGKIDSVDVVVHFGLRADVSMSQLYVLEKEGMVNREELAGRTRLHYVYGLES